MTQFLPADLAGFVAAHPGIRIELDESTSREAVLAVLDGRADPGILADRTPALGLQPLPYRRDRLVLNARRPGPERPSELTARHGACRDGLPARAAGLRL